MKTRYKPFVVGLLVVFTGQQLQAQKPNSDPSLQGSAKSQTPGNGKTLNDVRESLQAKRKQTGTPANKGGLSLDGSEGAAEGGMSGSGAGSMGGGMGKGGMMSSGGSSMGMPGWSNSGAEGGSSGMSSPSSEKQKLIQLIQQLRERLKSKKYKREDVEKLLRSVLADYFQLDMEERVGEFDKVKARIAEMESKLQNRLDRQKEIIELQALQILHKADGLDFVIPGGDSGSGLGSMGMGMGMSGYSSIGPGMAGPGGMSGAGMGAGDSGGRDDLFGSGGSNSEPGTLPGSTSGDEIEAKSTAPSIGYDIGFGETKHLRLYDAPTDPSDPLSSYSEQKQNRLELRRKPESNVDKIRDIHHAMREFDRVFGHFPGAVNRHVKGHPPHSWRVALLPLLGHSDLYREYRFDQPWDSLSNNKLIEKMPKVFSDSEVAGKQTNSTFYVITGEETAFPLDRPTSWADITDEFFYTIGIVKAKLDIPWTKPEDIESKAAIQLLSAGGLVTSIDGAVFKIPANPPEDLLPSMITRSGGEVIHFNLLNIVVKQ